MNALSVLLLCAATYRITRLLAQDQITQPLRDRLDRWVAEGHAAQDKHRTPSRKSLAGGWLVELYTCPWCLSWWVGLAVSVGWWTAVGVAAPLFWVPVVAFTASAFTGIVSQSVVLLERLSEDND